MKSKKYPRQNVAFLLWLIIFVVIVLSTPSWATPDYAEKTAQGCKICHINEKGGELSTKGLEYSASGYVWPPKGGYRVLGPIRKSVRLLIGVLHIGAAFMWLGTILYVHIILRPGYASRGLPKGEVILGIISMGVVGITGTLLTISKIKNFNVLYASPWGILISAKIIIYVIMVSSALFVVSFVGPKLKKGIKKIAIPKAGIFDPVTLSAFDGKQGRPAYFSYKRKVFDATGLKPWENGTHVKHLAGRDLTDAIAKAPHGEEKLNALRVVGAYDAALSPPKSPAQKAFYFIAYMNLTLVFCVLFVIAFLKWGI
ncbi:MAG: cytochrome B5 [Nitrospirae bacterium]|nr:cytochrome B5 [Nitrospirota bacterium]